MNVDLSGCEMTGRVRTCTPGVWPSPVQDFEHGPAVQSPTSQSWTTLPLPPSRNLQTTACLVWTTSQASLSSCADVSAQSSRIRAAWCASASISASRALARARSSDLAATDSLTRDCARARCRTSCRSCALRSSACVWHCASCSAKSATASETLPAASPLMPSSTSLSSAQEGAAVDMLAPELFTEAGAGSGCWAAGGRPREP
mmetsp:Transcript_103099/g.300705  ORF Transcript_103099/g.300705 Transcript_103099/m.300705 type:complete len:203 (+) Transcript_103099:729-1337(+)